MKKHGNQIRGHYAAGEVQIDRGGGRPVVDRFYVVIFGFSTTPRERIY